MTIASLSALAIVAAGLSGLALLSQNDGGSSAGGGGGGDITTAEATGEQTASDSSESSQVDSGDVAAVAGSAVRSTRLLAVSDNPERLVRAEGVECGAGSASIEVSSDGGDTWNTSDTSLMELTGVRQLQFGEGGRVQLAYVDDACALQFARSYVYGGAWEAGPGAGGVWTLAADDESGDIVIGGSEVEAPCIAVGISGAGDSGIVLCDDSTVSVSEDGGDSWSDPVGVAGGQAVTAVEDAYAVAGVDADGCEGLNIRSFDGSTVSDPGECIEGDFDSDSIAVSAGGGSLYLWAGEQVMRSDDRGVTWE